MQAMRAVFYHKYGGPEVLEYGERPDPKVGPDSVLVEVRAAAVNPVDWKALAGHLDPMLDAVFPVIPGWDMAGVVVRPGADAPEFKEGDEVIGYVREDFLSRGTLAEYVAAPVRTLAAKPQSLPFPQAAALPLAGLTAYQALTKALHIGSRDILLVHGAAGGVGSMAVQLGRRLGARVIGTTREGQEECVAWAGGEPVTSGRGLADRIHELAPEGVDAVLDLVGNAVWLTEQVLRTPGRIVSVTDPGVAGIGGRYLWVRPDAADLTALSTLADAGDLSVHVAGTFPLSLAADAHRLSMRGGTRGKIVVLPTEA
jgi:NADPH:quinone reductase-like Zn-dependent oxidoreductase